MEMKVNAALLGALLLAWAHVTASDPVAALDPRAPATAELTRMEDAYARRRADSGLARDLAERYLALGRADLAVNALSAAAPGVRRDPAVLHQLARAYEIDGRVPDALATARLARARCARALGTADAPTHTQVPEHRCAEGTLVTLRTHESALRTMARWGIQDPTRDPRAERAYGMAIRSARLVQAATD
ncbi:MAG: hypothetical protein ACFCGT_20065 [Sandaracinaceae bacterium]